MSCVRNRVSAKCGHLSKKKKTREKKERGKKHRGAWRRNVISHKERKEGVKNKGTVLVNKADGLG